MFIPRLLFSLFFFGAVAPVFTQKKVLGLPLPFQAPTDVFTTETTYARFMDDTQNKAKKEAWLVISDRDENQVFESPSLNARVLGKIDFRENFYVIEEQDGWVKLVDAQVDELRIINLRRVVGWVPKKNLLLWNFALVSPNSKIHKKALLLNRADDFQNIVKLADRLQVDIFRGPTAGVKEPDRKIFEFYFILKKENGRLLLSEEAIVSPFSIEKIIGWVSERRCSAWDTRICVEPNFDPEAFRERRTYPQFQIRAFRSEAAAKQFAETAGDTETEVFWKDDPVGLPAEKLSKSNPHRFNGYVMRFPVLNVSQKLSNQPADSFSYLRSGIIGSIKIRKSDNQSEQNFDSEISETDYSRLKSYVNELEQRANRVNIFLLLEATDSTFAYRDQIVEALQNLNANVLRGVPSVRYGALLYRDIAEEKPKLKKTDGKPTTAADRLVELVSLTPDLDRVTNFLKNADFQNKNDRDEYTALYFGLDQALRQANFPKNELNILMLIGSYGDYRIDQDRKKAAQKTRHKTFFDDLTPLLENLAAIDAHIYGIQLRNDGTRAALGFARQGEFQILESAKFAYNKHYGNRQNLQTQELLDNLNREHGFQILEPQMSENATGLALNGGRFPGRLVRPAVGRYVPPAQVAATISENVRQSLDFEQKLSAIVNQVFVKGDNLDFEEIEGEFKVDAGRFAPALADWLNEILSDDEVAKKNLYDALDNKYKLYTEVYLPSQIRRAAYPAFSYVLFMPESDLLSYQRTIQRCLSGAESSYDRKREKLFDIYTELIVQFSGETLLRQKKPSDFTRHELIQIMQGLYGSGLNPQVGIDLKISEIRDERKISDEQIDQLLLRFKTVEQALSTALRAAEQYEFCYSTDSNNRYYWIPLSDAF